MGADRALLVSDDAAAGSDLVATSYVLAAVLEREQPDLVLFGQQASDSDGAVLWAAVAERLQRPLVSQAAELELDGGKVRVEAADRVRLRPDRGAAPGRRRRLGCDQRAALPVAEGDHGREVQAAGDALARRSRARRRARGRGRLTDGGLRPAAAALARRVDADRGRRLRRAEDRRLPGGEEARLCPAPWSSSSTTRARSSATPSACSRKAARARRRRRRGRCRLGRSRARGAGRRARRGPRLRRRRSRARGAAPAAAGRRRSRRSSRARASTRSSSASPCSPPTSPPASPRGWTRD